MLAPELQRNFNSASSDLDCSARAGGGACREAAARGWRVKLGRAVRLELERSVWLGEGPGQPGSLHLR